MSAEDILIAGALGCGALAAEFASQPETFPAFLAWCQNRSTVQPDSWTPESIAAMADQLYDLLHAWTERLTS